MSAQDPGQTGSLGDSLDENMAVGPQEENRRTGLEVVGGTDTNMHCSSRHLNMQDTLIALLFQASQWLYTIGKDEMSTT